MSIASIETNKSPEGISTRELEDGLWILAVLVERGLVAAALPVAGLNGYWCV